MTAYVVWGVSFLPEENAADGDRIEERARTPLIAWLGRAENIDDTFAWTLAALTRHKLEEKQREVLVKHFERAFAGREHLGAYGRACLLLAAVELGAPDARAVLLRNLENGAQRASAAGYGDTVHWGSGAGYFRATDNAVECTALTLLALLAADPDHALVEPAANWLALNRRSAHWSSTRDTTFAVLALARHAGRAGKDAIDAGEVEVLVNGQPAGRVKIDRASVLGQRLALDVPPASLRAGDNEIAAGLASGRGPVYVLGLAEAWADNDIVAPADHLVTAARVLERRVPKPTLAGTVRYESTPLAPNGAAQTGEEVVMRVRLTVPNDLEYVMVEVPRPAGCEPLNPLSGYDARLRRVTTDGAPAKDDEGSVAIYRDEHDDRTAFFLASVSAGTWEIRYSLRAVTPGDFRAAPVRVEAMYAPEVRANTGARRVRITPRE